MGWDSTRDDRHNFRRHQLWMEIIIGKVCGQKVSLSTGAWRAIYDLVKFETSYHRYITQLYHRLFSKSEGDVPIAHPSVLRHCRDDTDHSGDRSWTVVWLRTVPRDTWRYWHRCVDTQYRVMSYYLSQKWGFALFPIGKQPNCNNVYKLRDQEDRYQTWMGSLPPDPHLRLYWEGPSLLCCTQEL